MDLIGVFVISHTGIKALFELENQTYQIAKSNKVNSLEDQIYFMSNVQNTPIPFDFHCGHDYLDVQDINNNHHNYRSGDLSGCIEIAMEIDYFTSQTFDNYTDAIDWSLEMMAVANILYLDEIGFGIKSNSAEIWETQDPYALFVEDAKNMLTSIRDTWIADEALSSINRHLVHLFSKRNNTGTGGIAFLNGVGSNWSGYGFSSNLTGEQDYIDLPVPYFFWNIYCLTHELGHNFGARHTQWCGWPGGPIDNCASIEEMVPGECASYNNNPSPEVGTIMSYCHTWSINDGGGIIMKFHNYVKNSIISYMLDQDLDDCGSDVIFGCVDSEACNYNVEANIDDGLCGYPDSGYDCLGNCLFDNNEDGICDDSVSFDEQKIYNISLYPNPAKEFIYVNMDNLSVNLNAVAIVNTLGQYVLFETNVASSARLNISSIPPGIYSAYLMTDSEVLKSNIIIQ